MYFWYLAVLAVIVSITTGVIIGVYTSSILLGLLGWFVTEFILTAILLFNYS
jgi:hypothetical protein